MAPQKLGVYEVFGTIGRGRFTKIRYGVNSETKEQVAVKSIDTPRLESVGLLDEVKKEISIIKAINSPHVIGIKDIFATNNRIFLVMDLMNGKNLQELLTHEGPMNEATARFFFRQIVDGLSYCHDVGVSHGNLKLENILLDGEGHLKISDFSRAYIETEVEANSANSRIKISTRGISTYYIAPEIINDECSDRKKLDVWNLGVILYALVTGNLPFDCPEEDLVSLFKAIRVCNYKELPSNLSEELKDLLGKILVTRPKDRLSLEQVKEHPWYINPDIYNSINHSYHQQIWDKATTSEFTTPIQTPMQQTQQPSSQPPQSTSSTGVHPDAVSSQIDEFREQQQRARRRNVPEAPAQFGLFSFVCNPFSVFSRDDSTPTTLAPDDEYRPRTAAQP